MRWVFLILAVVAILPTQASCIKMGSACIDNTPCKSISGYTVCLSDVGQSCWTYEDTYTCLKPNAINYCTPFAYASPACWQTSTSCIETDSLFGTGCMKSRQTWRCSDPSRPTPSNTIRLADTYTLVSSHYNTSPCAGIAATPGCSIAEDRCIQTTPDSPLPPGISSSSAAPDGCYKRERKYACYSIGSPLSTGCMRTQSTCTDATPSKVISSVTVNVSQVGGCWQYRDDCLSSSAINYCTPFELDARCRKTNDTCVQTDTTFGTGCMKYSQTWRCDDEKRPTPSNTVKLADTYTLVSSNYDTSQCSGYQHCAIAEDRCIQTTPDSPLPPGISSSSAAPDGCYKREVTYACLGTVDASECDRYASDPDCSLVETKPCEEDDKLGSQCLFQSKTYRCKVQGQKSQTVADCGTQTFCLEGKCFDTGHEQDSDFARVITYMEAAREAGMYLDEGSLRIFSGRPSACTIKALNNCCKAKTASPPTNAQVIKTVIDGAVFSYKALRSTYMYDTLFQADAPDWVLKGFDMIGNRSTNPTSFSYYGFTISAGGATTTSWIGQQIGVNAITLTGPNSPFVISFDPVSFVIAIGLNFVLDALMSCDQDDMITGMRRGANLCVQVGEYCSSYIGVKPLRTCIEKKRSHCCYNSRLARIINEQGRAQIGKGWGSAQSPDCSGFTADELQRLDFSKMDLSAFYAEIQPKNLDVSAIQSAMQNRVMSNPTKSYFQERQ